MEDAAFVIQSSSSPSSAMHDVDGLWENIAEIRMKKLFRSCRGRCKMSSFFSGRQRRAEKPVQQCKARDQNDYPYPEDNAYSDCAIDPEKPLVCIQLYCTSIMHGSPKDREKWPKEATDIYTGRIASRKSSFSSSSMNVPTTLLLSFLPDLDLALLLWSSRST